MSADDLDPTVAHPTVREPWRVADTVRTRHGLSVEVRLTAAEPTGVVAPPGSAATTPAGPGQLPSQLGRYPVRGRIGGGGMGEILEVEDTELGRRIAAKRMLAPDDPELLEKFLLEAKVTGQLEHPNIVAVHELGLDDGGRVYFTMTRVEGRTLADVLEERTQTAGFDAAAWSMWLARLLRILEKVCDALEFAHSRGVIHRDLKPANIMVGRFGEVLLMDWGLAKIVGARDVDRPRAPGAAAPEAPPVDPGPPQQPIDDALRTQQGVVLGTPAFMPPEQAEGWIDRLDQRSDIYSLGAILYQILTGLPPFSGPGTVILADIRQGHVVPPSQRAGPAAVPWELEAVVLRAMAKDPEARYQTVAGLREELERFAAGQTLRAASYRPWQVLAKWARRHRALVGGTAAAVLVGVVVAIVMFVQVLRARDRAEAERTRADRRRREAVAARDRADRARGEADDSRRRAEDAGRLNGANLLAFRARTALASRRHAEALAYLEAALGVRVTPLSWAAGWALPPLRARLDRVTGIPVARLNAAWLTGDGHQLLLGDRGRAAVVRVADGRRVAWTLFRHKGWVEAVDLDPRRGELYTAGPDDPVRVWRLNSTMKPVRTFADRRARSHQVTALALSPDRHWLISGGRRGQVLLWQAQRGQLFRTLGAGRLPVRVLRWAPGGERFYAGGEAGGGLWHQRGGRVCALAAPGRVLAAAFSVKGTRLLTGDDAGRVRLWDLADGRLLATLAGHRGPVEGVAFSGDGQRLASGGQDGTLRIWSRDGEPLDVVPCGGRVAALGRDVEEGLLAAVEPYRQAVQLRRYALPRGRATRTHTLPAAPTSVALRAGRVAVGARDHRLRVVGLADGQQAYDLTGHDAAIHAVAASPDGRWLASAGRDRRVIVREAATGAALQQLDGHDGPVHALAWIGSGRLASAGSAGRVLLHDGPTGGPLGQLEVGRRVGALAASADGRRLAGGSEDGRIRVWDLATRQAAPALDAHRGAITDLVFTPGGALLSTGTDRSARLWDLAARTVRHVLPHAAPVTCAGCTPDGATLVTGDAAGWLCAWDAATGMLLLRLQAHAGGVSDLALDRSGRVLVTTGEDRQVRLWGLDAPTGAAATERLTGLRRDGIRLEPLDPAAYAARRESTPEAGRPLWKHP